LLQKVSTSWNAAVAAISVVVIIIIIHDEKPLKDSPRDSLSRTAARCEQTTKV
jgi:hypothetical protein